MDAERLAGEFFARCTADRLPESAFMSTVGGQFYAIRSAQGRLDELVETVEGLVGANPDAPVWRLALVGALLETDQIEAARESFDWLAGDGCANVPLGVNYALTLCGLARTVLLLDPGEHVVGPIYEKVLPFRGRFNWAGSMVDAPADLGLGMAAEMLGRPEVADAHFADCLALCERTGARTWLARTEFDWGRVLARRGDRAAARGHLERAIVLGEETGSTGPFGLVARSRALLGLS